MKRWATLAAVVAIGIAVIVETALLTRGCGNGNAGTYVGSVVKLFGC